MSSSMQERQGFRGLEDVFNSTCDFNTVLRIRALSFYFAVIETLEN